MEFPRSTLGDQIYSRPIVLPQGRCWRVSSLRLTYQARSQSERQKTKKERSHGNLTQPNPRSLHIRMPAVLMLVKMFTRRRFSHWLTFVHTVVVHLDFEAQLSRKI